MTIDNEASKKLPLVQHLIELRRSLLHSVTAIVIFFLILFPFADEIYTFIAAPIVQAIPGSNLIAIGVISPFLTPLKMSLILAIYIAMPYLLYQPVNCSEDFKVSIALSSLRCLKKHIINLEVIPSFAFPSASASAMPLTIVSKGTPLTVCV